MNETEIQIATQLVEIKNSYTVECDFIHAGLRCVVVLLIHAGYRCGYVGIPQTHTLYGVAYNDISPKINSTPSIYFECHGHITYSSSIGPVVADNTWWYGFDCAHFTSGDAPDFSHVDNQEYRKAMSAIFRQFGGTIRTREFVAEECKSLAQQLGMV